MTKSRCFVRTSDLGLVSRWLLFNAKWEILQLYHGENKLQSTEWWYPLCAIPTC